MQININPDKDFVAHMRKALKDNNGFCPCAIVRSEDTKCMCKEFRGMEEGTCHCGLYIKIKDKPAAENADHCICCGAVIPEGRMVCPNCGE